MHRTKGIIVWALIGALPACIGAQPVAESAQRAVQRFYDWYVPRQEHAGGPDTWMVALTRGPLQVDPELVRWFRIDSTAQARAKGEIDGIDWDPFLASQDPCKAYTTAPPIIEGVRVYIPVHCRGQKAPAVLVEVRHVKTGWMIVEWRNPKSREGIIPAIRRLHPSAR